MPKVKDPVAGAFVGVAVAIFGAIAVLVFMGGLPIFSSCKSSILWEVPSPDALLKATVIRRQCEGQAAIGSVSILSGMYFIRRTAVGNVVPYVAHPEALSIRWEGTRTVVIGYANAEPLKIINPLFMTQYGPVKIRSESK